MIARCFIVALSCLGGVSAQLLYDPEPPANSAFVRIVNVSEVNQKPQIGKVFFNLLIPSSTSPYHAINQGSHDFLMMSKKIKLEFFAQKFYTLISREPTPLLLEDKIPTRTKALLSVYNLSSIPSVDLKTEDNKVLVIADVKPNTVKSQYVNAIKIGFLLTQSEVSFKKLTPVQLERGFGYSVFVFSKSKTIWLKNTTQK
jgi:alginate O-acetyltransferase complex protein AlgF